MLVRIPQYSQKLVEQKKIKEETNKKKKIVLAMCQELYELCIICLEFCFWIVPKRIKFTRLMKCHNF